MADGSMKKPSLIQINVNDAANLSTSKPLNVKPPFRPAKDDTKPVLRDPISRSDPIQTSQSILFPRDGRGISSFERNSDI